MRQRLIEQSVLFASVLKWVALAAIIGVTVGGSTAMFLKLLNWSVEVAGRYPDSLWLLPVGLFIGALLVKYLTPDAAGFVGMDHVIEAIHERSGRIKLLAVPANLCAIVITLALGGSAGKEGPCAYLGAASSSLLANLLRFDDSHRRKLVICGISASFAAVFGTPIAGALFGVELLFVGALLYEVLLPSFVAGIVAFHVSSHLGVTYFHHPIERIPVFSESFFLKLILGGIVFGVGSFCFIEIMRLGTFLSRRLLLWLPLKGVGGGLAIVSLTLLFSRQFLGLGLDTIVQVLQGEPIVWYAFVLKPVFTSITLNFGGSGGLITPMLFTGATLGSAVADLLGVDRVGFSAIGMVAVLAGSANTPIAASLMAIELFGPEIGPYAGLACVVSFLMTGHRSAFPSQVLVGGKSQSLDVELGRTLRDVKAYRRRRTGD